MRHISIGLFLIGALFAEGCGNLTTVGNPQGLPTEITFTSDIGSAATLTVDSGEACRGVSSACASPSAYSIASIQVGFFSCGDDVPCPGEEPGEEVPAASIVGNVTVVKEGALNQFIYIDGNVSGDPAFGSVDPFQSDPIEEAGWIGGIQILMDFVMLQIPEEIINWGVSGPSAEYVLLFLNQNGFDNVADYPEAFAPLAEKGIQFGDLVFSLSGEWYFFDTDLGNFVTERPASPLSQEITLEAAEGGQSIYNASLSDDQLFEITQYYLDASATLVVNVPWSAELNIYWSDTNANAEVDLGEVVSFEVGKPQISYLMTMQLTFQ